MPEMSEIGEKYACPFTLRKFGLERFPKGCVFLFQGPSGSGKTVMADNLIAEQLANGLNACILTLSRSPENVRESIRQLGFAVNQRLIIVDGYSWLIGENISKDGYALSSLSSLSDISIMITMLMNFIGKNSLFVFDHVSTILSFNEENQVVRLIQTLAARIREAHDWAIFVFESDIHNQSFYNTVRFLVDCVIDFKIEEIGGNLYRAIRVHQARFQHSDTQWHPIEIMENGKLNIQPSIVALSKEIETSDNGIGRK